MVIQGNAGGRTIATYRVAFRVDASLEIGTGHVMRCLTLADALRERGAECIFIHRAHAGNMAEMIRARDHAVRELPAPAVEDGWEDTAEYARWLGVPTQQDASDTREVLGEERPDWLVVDHYALDSTWEAELRPVAGSIAALDDLADRPHDCDLLLDQNLGRSEQDYSGLVPKHCNLLIGPRFALLRPEFARLRGESLERRRSPQLERILVSMGGVDKDNATGRVLEALCDCTLPANLEIDVVMGGNAPWLQAVKDRADGMPWPTQVSVDVSDMAQRMVESDLAIGAAGSTSWERCCLGLPTVSLITAENQRNSAVALERIGAIRTAEITIERNNISLEIQRFVDSPELLERTSILASEITDGFGRERVRKSLLETV